MKSRRRDGEPVRRLGRSHIEGRLPSGRRHVPPPPPPAAAAKSRSARFDRVVPRLLVLRDFLPDVARLVVSDLPEVHRRAVAGLGIFFPPESPPFGPAVSRRRDPASPASARTLRRTTSFPSGLVLSLFPVTAASTRTCVAWPPARNLTAVMRTVRSSSVDCFSTARSHRACVVRSASPRRA